MEYNNSCIGEMNRILYPVQHMENQLQHSLWVCELVRLTGFELILIDMTDSVGELKEDIRVSFLDSLHSVIGKKKHPIKLNIQLFSSLTKEFDSVILVGTPVAIQEFYKRNDTRKTLSSISLPEAIEFPVDKQNSLADKIKRSKAFYAIFKQADKVKLPQALFLNLGRDKDLFNQLISFFSNRKLLDSL